MDNRVRKCIHGRRIIGRCRRVSGLRLSTGLVCCYNPCLQGDIIKSHFLGQCFASLGHAFKSYNKCQYFPPPHLNSMPMPPTRHSCIFAPKAPHRELPPITVARRSPIFRPDQKKRKVDRVAMENISTGQQNQAGIDKQGTFMVW